MKQQQKDVFARVATAGAAMARGLGVIFSLAGWIGLVATLGMTAYEFFKTKDATEETKDEFGLLGEKLKSVNEELKHFNEIQNILNEDGKATVATLGNMGRAFANVGAQMFAKAASQYMLSGHRPTHRLLVWEQEVCKPFKRQEMLPIY